METGRKTFFTGLPSGIRKKMTDNTRDVTKWRGIISDQKDETHFKMS